VICDVCFQRADPDADMCARCGTVFGDPEREHHDVEPSRWVEAQLSRLRAMGYDGLRALPSLTQTFTFDADDGSFRGEVRVSFDDEASRAGTAQVTAAIWAAGGDRPLASGELIHHPDG
jgi:hypothetical protein